MGEEGSLRVGAWVSRTDGASDLPAGAPAGRHLYPGGNAEGGAPREAVGESPYYEGLAPEAWTEPVPEVSPLDLADERFVGQDAPTQERPEEWQLLPDPDAQAPGDGGAGSGRYRGRRRLVDLTGRRAARWGTAAVVAAVGVVLIGSGVLARALSDPVAVPVLPPSPSPSQTVVSSPPGPPAQLGLAPSATPTPTPSPTPTRTPPPERPQPEPPPPAADPPPPGDPDPDPDPQPDPEPEPVNLSVEAEDGDLGGDAEVVSRFGASGGEAVRLVGWWPGHSVRFTGITVERDGDYELTLVYDDNPCCSDDAVRIEVNGGQPVVVDLPTTPGGSFRSATVSVELDEGANTIRVTANFDDAAPDLDLITVTG